MSRCPASSEPISARAPQGAARAEGISRRRMMTTGAALAVGLAGTAATAPPAAAGVAPGRAPGAVPPPVRLVLPRPSGGQALGTTALHLIDHQRRDPWVPTRPVREVMVQLWYPARAAAGLPRAPWMTAASAQVFQQTGYLRPEYATLPDTHARSGAPADLRQGRRPVIVYSHGHGQHRGSSTALVEELASHGYVVVTIDHTYDAGQVEFPGGRVESYAMPTPTGDDDPTILKAVEVRVADTRFVLAELARRVRDRRHPLPHGVGDLLDLSRTAMFGHSLGGATAASALAAGVPLAAGADLDGTLFGPVVAEGLRRPLLLMGADRDTDSSWSAIWPRLHGWRRGIRVTGTLHFSYTDYEAFMPQVAARLGATDAQLAEFIGPLDAARALALQRKLLVAYFDLHLRGRRTPILDGPSPRYPELRFFGGAA
ncbi:alpha/beta hydrolase family protein [Streptomyces sp. H39-S7]|uniref:alpha/beta hydrolase family protein n=1 Tax=Streptomyces sp. H39-S7 TaxID=3004357 RepID=UPI0022B06026|nr:lipase [Streptomyces sp. H39-S7]MCZ4122723.1 lipase [Streptomyces sp. H39-S7]